MEEQNQLEEVYVHHNTGQYVFETTASFGQDPTWWSLNAPMALVLVLPSDDELLKYYYEKLRNDVPRATRILFLAPVITPALMQVSGLFDKVRVIKTPVSSFFLYRGLVDITTDYPSGKQQVHPRYLTDQAVEVESSVRSQRSKGQMRNLSAGGMYFELVELIPSYRIEDLVKVTVGIKGGKSYQFDAKIVWAKSIQGQNATGYGCTFLNRDQVYDTLLSQVSR